MKRILKIAALVLAVLLIGIQFVRPDKTNPPTDPAATLEATTNTPPKVAEILGRSCADCHSNNTYYPWYAQVSPVSWWLKDHINEGRRELNISEFGTYNDTKKGRKLHEICEQVQHKEMPLPSYLWIHHDASLSDNDINILCNWAESEGAKYPQ
jgi:Haem-binding domain